MELFIVRGPYGQLFGIYSSKEKAEERAKRTGKSYVVKTCLDRDTMMYDIQHEKGDDCK